MAVRSIVAMLGSVLLLLQCCAAGTRLCLNMIVKDEAEDIIKSLNSLASDLSGWTVCDTGSTDDTPELATGFFKGRVPGKLVHHNWTNHGFNRNLCMKAGLEWSLQQARKQGLPAGQHFCQYLWHLDADQILHPPPGAQPGGLKAMNLTANGYQMMERSTGSWHNVRLTSTAVPWRWEAELHEYLVSKHDDSAQHKITGYWIEHFADAEGGARLKRDVQVLTKKIEANPKDSRSHYYLARAYRSLGEDEAAIKHYAIRVGLDAWHEEERYLAALAVAEIATRQYQDGELISQQVKAHLSNWDAAVSKLSPEEEAREEQMLLTAQDEEDEEDSKAQPAASTRASGTGGTANGTAAASLAAPPDSKVEAARKAREFHVVVAAYAAAMQILPYRSEPYSRLARLYLLERRDYERCYSWAASGLAQGAPGEDALFVNTYSSRYELLDMACTCGYYVPRGLQQGQYACVQLQQAVQEGLQEYPGNTVLEDLRDRAKKSLGWYETKAARNTTGTKEGAACASGQCSWASGSKGL